MLKFLGLQKYKWVAKYIPILVMTITTIEDMMADSTGEEKKKAVKDYIQDLLKKHSPLDKAERANAMEFVDSSIDFFVMIFNKYELFGNEDLKKVKKGEIEA